MGILAIVISSGVILAVVVVIALLAVSTYHEANDPVTEDIITKSLLVVPGASVEEEVDAREDAPNSEESEDDSPSE